MMRVDNLICQKGYFSLPNNIEDRLSGTLSINDGGKIELEIIGTFSGEEFFSLGMGRIDRIIGVVDQLGPVTLDRCSFTNRHVTTDGICISSLSVARAYIGAMYEEHEDIKFNCIEFSVEGLDEWVGKSGIQAQFGGTSPDVSITYTEPEKVSVTLKNGMTLEILFRWNASPVSMPLKEIVLTQKTYFRLSSKCDIPFSDYIPIIYKFTNFIGFAVRKTVSNNSMLGLSDDIQIKVSKDKTVFKSIKIYYSSLPFSSEVPKISVYEILFGLSQISSNTEEVFDAWLDAYDTIEPSMNLFFATKTGAYKFLSGRFLALAQCLESFHRMTSTRVYMDPQKYRELISAVLETFPEKDRAYLGERLNYGFELSLASRLKELLKPFREYFGNKEEQGKFIRSIIDTRNYYTHYDEILKNKVAKGKDMYILCMKMEFLFQLHLFTILKFPEPTIDLIFNKKLNPQLKLED